MLTRRTPILLASALLALGVCWVWLRPSEPKYHGRTLAQWFAASRLEDQAARPSAEEYNEAIRALGTNDLAGLARRIWFDPNHCTPRTLINILPASVTPERVLQYLYERQYHLDSRATDAILAFQALGSQGAPAIPELTKIAMHGAPGPAMRAVDCLGLIGEKAVPTLTMVATNPQTQNIRAFRWLLLFTNSPQATQIVAQYARDPRLSFLVGPLPGPTTTNTQAH